MIATRLVSTRLMARLTNDAEYCVRTVLPSRALLTSCTTDQSIRLMSNGARDTLCASHTDSALTLFAIDVLVVGLGTRAAGNTGDSFAAVHACTTGIASCAEEVGLCAWRAVLANNTIIRVQLRIGARVTACLISIYSGPRLATQTTRTSRAIMRERTRKTA